MSAYESRPAEAEAAPEVCATDPILSQEGTFSLDDVLTSERVGFDLGWHARGEANAQERVAEILHEHACHWLGIARKQATENHGPAWAELVVGDDGE